MDKTSLFYKVFSAKYFPSVSVFDAKSSKGSYAWRSILKARLVVEKGCFRELGMVTKPEYFMIIEFRVCFC